MPVTHLRQFRLSPEIKMEMLNNFSQDYIAQVIEEITRFLTDHEQGIFVRLSNTLGLTKVLSMLETCKEPWADKCRYSYIALKILGMLFSLLL